MENNDSKSSNSDTPDKLSPTSTNVQTNNQTKKPKKLKSKSSEEKWSLWEHWKRASRAKQAKWSAAVMTLIITAGILGTYIVGLFQTKSNFAAEHRPKVVLNRPPELLGTFECEVTDKAIHMHSGAMRFYVKNIRKGDALGAFVDGPSFQLVPEKKTGNAFFDDIPSITDQTCKREISPKMKAFPVYSGQEVAVDMVQSVGAESLIPTKSISVTFGGPQKEPETPAGEKPGTRVPIDKDAVFQLYAPVCSYYFDEVGNRYGSCREYRLAVKGRVGKSDNYSFSCTESPISGTFETVFFGYCEN